ncbi:HlyD family secretion protein, partial [Pseudomonas syringae]
SVGYGVSVGQTPAPGSLPSVQNSRDWLRPAQRFPVIIEFSEEAWTRLRDSGAVRAVRAGGQAEVMAFPTQGNLLTPLGRLFVGLMSWLSYVF